MSKEDEVKFTVSQDMRKSVKAIKSIMEEWAAVLDMFYHHFNDTIKPELPDNEPFVNSTKAVYNEIISMPIEIHYVKRICEELGVPFEEYTKYREILLSEVQPSKPKRRD